MTERWRAYVVEDWQADPFTRTARLVVVDSPPYGRPSLLTENGTWRMAEEGARVTDAGLVLPLESLPAILEGIEQWQGRQNHAATESAVLREWLAVERERVDRSIALITLAAGRPLTG